MGRRGLFGAWTWKDGSRSALNGLLHGEVGAKWVVSSDEYRVAIPPVPDRSDRLAPIQSAAVFLLLRGGPGGAVFAFSLQAGGGYIGGQEES